MIEGVQTAIFNSKNELLIAKRSKIKKLAPERWNLIGGKIEEGESVIYAALREIREEVSLFLRESNILEVNLKKVSWNNKDYFYCNTLVAYSEKDKVILNVEHSEYQWINKKEISKFNIVGYSKEELLKLFEIFENEKVFLKKDLF